MANLNINKVILGGRITNELELKQTQSGIATIIFSMAIQRKSNNQESDFINCRAWRNTAEFISKYFKKGNSICVVGALQNREWQDKQGNKRTSTEVIVDEAYFVDSKNENSGFVELDPNAELPF